MLTTEAPTAEIHCRNELKDLTRQNTRYSPRRILPRRLIENRRLALLHILFSTSYIRGTRRGVVLTHGVIRSPTCTGEIPNGVGAM